MSNNCTVGCYFDNTTAFATRAIAYVMWRYRLPLPRQCSIDVDLLRHAPEAYELKVNELLAQCGYSRNPFTDAVACKSHWPQRTTTTTSAIEMRDCATWLSPLLAVSVTLSCCLAGHCWVKRRRAARRTRLDSYPARATQELTSA
jgi:hypothetical protein